MRTFLRTVPFLAVLRSQVAGKKPVGTVFFLPFSDATVLEYNAGEQLARVRNPDPAPRFAHRTKSISWVQSPARPLFAFDPIDRGPCIRAIAIVHHRHAIPI